MSLWRLDKVEMDRPERKEGANVIPGTLGHVRYVPVNSSDRRTLLIYKNAQGMWFAYLTGKEGANVSSMLPSSRWEELNTGPMAVVALTGKFPTKYPLQEII